MGAVLVTAPNSGGFMEGLQGYNTKVYLGGTKMHCVPKTNISDREIALLKHIHGDDCIVKEDTRKGDMPIKDKNGKVLDEKTELLRLALRYGKDVVEKFFNVKLDMVQIELADDDDYEDDDEDEQEEEQAPVEEAPKLAAKKAAKAIE